MVVLDVHGRTASICIDGVWSAVTLEIIAAHPWILKYIEGPVAARYLAQQFLEEIDALERP